MNLRFSGSVWYWRGPSPFHFVTVPEADSAAIRQVAGAVTYGWGMIPATVRLGDTEWYTALWPKDGGYIVPIKQWVRDAEAVDVDDVIELQLTITT